MRYYDFLNPSVNFMGPNCVELLGERCQILGMNKPMIVTDGFLASMENGPVAQSVASLEKAGIEYVIFTGVEPNPKIQNCYSGLEMYKAEGCDSIITVGGGSAHDCGKGIGIVATHDGNIAEYAGIEKLTNALPPIVAVNTTAGTASEVTRHCVLTNADTKLKFVIVSWRNVPLVSFNDPMLMLEVPAGLTAATGMDALTHAIETYVSVDANPVTDAVAIQAIKLISGNLRQAVANGYNVEARENMAYGSLLAGMAFNNGNLGYVHAMAHQLGGQYDLPHGVANALLLPYVLEYNADSPAREKYLGIAKAMGVDTTGMDQDAYRKAAIDAVQQLSIDVGIPTKLEKLAEEDLPFLCESAKADACAPGNPTAADIADVEAMFRKLM